MTFTLNWESGGFLPQFALVAQPDKTLPAMWETWVQSLGWEDPLEEELATHFSMLLGPHGYSPWGPKRARHD